MDLTTASQSILLKRDRAFALWQFLKQTNASMDEQSEAWRDYQYLVRLSIASDRPTED